MFPSWEAVARHREVIIFSAGLMKDSRPLVQFMYEMQVEDYLSGMRTGGSRSIYADLFRTLHTESSVKWPADPLHNEYIHYYDHDEDDEKKRPRDVTPIKTASRLYEFNDMKENIQCNIEECELSECSMWINSADKAVMKNLLMTCHRISQQQPLTGFDCTGRRDVDLTAVGVPVMSKNTQSLVLSRLPVSYLKNILPQLFRCSDSLKRLELYEMDLKEVERDIDELLEHIVSQHETEQFTGNLRLSILGGSKAVENKDGTVWSITDLSDEFIDRWRRRCEAISTIDLSIGSASWKDIFIASSGRENYNFYKNHPDLSPQEARSALGWY